MWTKRLVCLIFCGLLILQCGCGAGSAVSETASETQSDRIILTLGCSEQKYFPTDFVNAFNASQETYEIQGVYYDGEDNEERRTQLLADMQAGGGPDLIFATYFGLTQQDADAKTYLADLRPYIDADPELSWSSFVPAVWDTYAPDGALYVTASDFCLTALHVRGSVGATSLSYRDLLSLADQYGDEAIEYEPYELGGYLVYQALAACMESETAFDTSLPDALILDKRLSMQDAEAGKINTDGLMFCSTLYSFSDLQFWRTAFGEDVTLMGLPGQSGGSLRCLASSGFCMNQNSANQEGAWEFLRTFLTASYQEENSAAFPTNQEAFDAKRLQAQQTGDEEIVLQFSLEYVDYEPVSDEDIDTITEFISNTQNMDRTTSWEFVQMENLVSPIVTQYLNDEISLDEAVQQIKACRSGTE
jgi:ABC-type glycerol-3-phosphate transport system substrate-binding protein